MGILDIGGTPTPLTSAAKQAQAKKRLLGIGKGTLAQLSQSHNQIMKIVWDNPRGLTPHEVVAGLGTDAVALFGMLRGLRAFVEAVQPGHITFEAPMKIIPNADGTITLEEFGSESAGIEDE